MTRPRLASFALALMLAGLSLAGCARAAPPPRTFSEKASDAMITMSVKMSLAFERGVKASEIDVDTDRGTVTLKGEVGTQAERQLAVKVTEDVSGVKEVVNQIHVRG